MAELKRTSKAGKGRASHQHIAYLRDNGDGITTKNSGHFHVLRQIPGIPAAMDQDPASLTYGQQISEAVEPSWEFMPGPDGHIHALTEAPIGSEARDDDETDESTAVQEIVDLYRQAKQYEDDSRKKAYEAEKLYAFDQWDAKTKKDLEGNDRAAHTVNIIEPAIDNLSGYQRQNRTDFRFLPTEEGDQVVSDILNVIVKNITEQCYYPREETKTFEDCARVGRGLFNIYEDYDKNIQGDIIIERFAWDESFIGPHEKEDLSDCEYLVKTKWYSLSKLREMYPEKAARFNPEDAETEVQDIKKSEDWDKRLSDMRTTAMATADTDLVDKVKKQYRKLELWRKVYEKKHILVNGEDNFVFSADGWSEADVASIRGVAGFRVIPRTPFRIKVSSCIAGVLLDRGYPELATQDFHIVPTYAKKMRNLWWGKIESVKDMQRLINKSYSQFTDILNRMAAYGWFYDNETFPNEQERKKFQKVAAKPGFQQKINDVTRPPKKEEGVKFPAEIVEAINVFSSTAREIMNIKLEMLGQAGQNESGVAIRQKIVQQLLGNDFIFDNLSFAKKKIGRIVVAMVQKLYSVERLLRILRNQHLKEPVELAGKKLDEYDPAEIAAMLKNADLTKYDVTVSESPASPSAMMGNFLLLLDMAGRGVQIPPSAFMRFAPIPGKEKIMEEIAAMAADEKAREERKYQAEIDKTQIAQQGKVAQNQGRGEMPLSGMPTA